MTSKPDGKYRIPEKYRIPGKYLSITSFRRDGTGVATPVWFVQADDGRLFVLTDAASWKVRRIRRDGSVRVAPCTASGRLRGERFGARAEVLADAERPRIERLMNRKYRLDRILVLPVYRAVQAIRHRGQPHGTPVALVITPE